ncbi:amino acid ABC transporter permease [Mesorhizobium sp. M1C.F.Ca.ET.193.01.1.1]|uniref:amino acid ABC transporter permease n=1 Tax=unclassified Mesorhizobium TaxID=325217 RepID=UPI000FD507E9|nr:MULTISPECIES: amino acid ABC transporter permease [unclassified Mesorhizobium]TGT00059.1 amino acid ABC transporter permease [bacterium M00.F.Ca.ET.177.01.1.1]TGQ53455.1 amino acid ABC transporter permease [Mesorhizobium sp. M1C.F.Ca.ET.210.01.1.1]TGQ70722.1 amino acid ABC transporter permease [Mesorhizobium sp. M1C.F.Ca.ET.212.01.1.1]TGR07295.1 amino acid ABC transporter permease [Mesorhizobium sp. M1C.F.Ca.ET.204.01.1.1]TGR28169.1 amino acid ABC transporter permease [Mesorhizobium sp. M1C
MEMVVVAPPAPGTLEDLRRRFFATPLQALLSLVSLAIMVLLAWKLLNWAIFSAVFTASGGPEACQAAAGACWSVIAARWRIILFGLYPFEEQWRSALACVTVVVMTVLSCIPAFWTGRRIGLVWAAGAALYYVLMKGGVLGLPYVGEEAWGGLALTLFIFVTTCLIGFPLAICLALLRRSGLPWISRITGIIIDSVRSLPLISILFTFAIVLPFALPQWLVGDKLYRVILGSALFFSAYQAEIVRGGMQGVSNGQEEAAMALGMNYWQRIGRILLPQAMRNALPATINQFVISFKETSLVVIVGFFEILASGNAAYGTGEWRFAYVEVYAFIAFIYFVFVFSLSRYGAFLERRMSVGER